MRSLTLLLATVLVGACGILDLGDETIRTYEVAPFKRSCFGLFATLCLQVREPGETAWENLYETPAGFDFEWGVAAVIEVEERAVDPVPADGSSIRRTLRRVVSRTPEPPGATFELFVLASGLHPAGSGRWRVYSGPEEVACAGSAACAGLSEETGGEGWIRLILTYPPTSGEALGVEGWAACEGPTGPCVEAGQAHA